MMICKNDALLTHNREVKMNYAELYYIVFNAITDALDSMNCGKYATAKLQLIAAQQKAEELYISADD